MAGLFDLESARRHLHWGPAPAPTLRAAVLDTGELVLLDNCDQAQVFSPRTTQLIRRVLAGHQPPAATLMPTDTEGGAHD